MIQLKDCLTTEQLELLRKLRTGEGVLDEDENSSALEKSHPENGIKTSPPEE